MKKDNSKKMQSQCELCAYFDYDETYEDYMCTLNMDEDDIQRFYHSHSSCPYFKFYDEYQIVRKQN